MSTTLPLPLPPSSQPTPVKYCLYDEHEGDYYTSNTVVLLPKPKGYPDLGEGNWTYKRLRQPMLLNDAYPYLPFLPKNPKLLTMGPIFGRLEIEYEDIPISTVSIARKTRYILESSLLDSWKRLENALYDVCRRLSQSYAPRNQVFMADLPLPSDHGYQMAHNTPQIVGRQVMRARDTFFIMAAMISFLICQWDEPTAYRITPNWMSVLLKLKYDAVWLTDLRNSIICHPSLSTCVGAFINPYTTRSARFIPLYLRSGVPFWINWGSDLCKEKIFDPKGLLPLYPPSERIVRAFNFPTRVLGASARQMSEREDFCLPHFNDSAPFVSLLSSPTSPVADHIDDNSFDTPLEPFPPVDVSRVPESDALEPLPLKPKPFPPLFPDSQQREGETWQEFFLRRAKDTEAIIARETSKDIQRRESLLRDSKAILIETGFSKKSNAFEWVLVDGHYMREKLPKGHIPEGYEGEDTYFDPYRNEWDLHPLFSECSKVDEFHRLIPAMPKIVPNPLPTGIAELTRSDTCATHTIDVVPNPSSSSSSESLELFKAQLYARFGFLSDPHTEYRPVAFNEKQEKWEKKEKETGKKGKKGKKEEEEKEVRELTVTTTLEALERLGATCISWNASEGQSLVDFFKAGLLNQVGLLKNVDWYNGTLDLVEARTRGVLKKYRSKTNSILYLFNLQDADWMVSISCPLTVVQIFRMNWPASTKDLVLELLKHGLTFSTVKRIDSQHRLVRAVTWQELGERPANHVFTDQDYAAYLSLRKSALEGPLGRVALMRGGIAWRLAKDVIGLEADVTNGPSEFAHRHGVIRGTFEDDSMVDDCLDDAAWELICGVYRIKTINKFHYDQKIHRSYWPLPSTWENSGRNFGYWSPDAEKWYNSRLMEIHNGKAKLMTQSEWKSHLRKYKLWSHSFLDGYTAVAKALLE